MLRRSGDKTASAGGSARNGVGAITVSRVTRMCARPGCHARATATLDYDYQAGVAHLTALADEPHPMFYDLCEDHAERLRLPLGWQLIDERGGPGTLFHLAG